MAIRATTSGLLKGGAISLVAGMAILVVSHLFGLRGGGDSPDDPAVLARTAAEALEAVKRRQPGERRPASYDSVLAPLDKLLVRARSLMESDAYNPVADYEKLRAILNPVVEIATRADIQARTETGLLVKEYRFNDQKGEACQYLAAGLWERINARQPASARPLDAAAAPPRSEMRDLARILDTGLEAAPGNRDLWYIRGVVNRAEGLFGPAARDLERAIAVDSEYAAAWNTLGLVRISLKEFDLAEDALERAKFLTLDHAKRLSASPGPEYVAIVYNLAIFHDNLAAFYNRDNRINPTVESQRLFSRHTAAARTYLEEFLRLEPADSPDAQTVREKLNSLLQ